MSRVIRRRWTGDTDAPSRRDRLSCEYEAYVPDLLTGRRITLDGDVAADIADAEAAIIRLNAEASSLADTEALARLLLRAESVASSRIEGLEIGARRLLRAEAAKELGERSQRAVEDAASFERRVERIEEEWRKQLGDVRSGSAADLLLRFIVGAPVLTVSGAAELIGRSYPQTNEAIQRLVSAGILSQVTVGRRNRAFEAPAIIKAFTDLERQLASPAADTRASPPARPVPPRRPTPPY
jgi:Fic family protein